MWKSHIMESDTNDSHLVVKRGVSSGRIWTIPELFFENQTVCYNSINKLHLSPCGHHLWHTSCANCIWLWPSVCAWCAICSLDTSKKWWIAHAEVKLLAGFIFQGHFQITSRKDLLNYKTTMELLPVFAEQKNIFLQEKHLSFFEIQKHRNSNLVGLYGGNTIGFYHLFSFLREVCTCLSVCMWVGWWVGSQHL